MRSFEIVLRRAIVASVQRLPASEHVGGVVASPTAVHAPAGCWEHPAETPLLLPSAMQRLTPALSPAEGVGGANAAAAEHRRSLRPIAAHLVAQADATNRAAAVEVRTTAAGAAQQRPQRNRLQLMLSKMNEE